MFPRWSFGRQVVAQTELLGLSYKALTIAICNGGADRPLTIAALADNITLVTSPAYDINAPLLRSAGC